MSEVLVRILRARSLRRRLIASALIWLVLALPIGAIALAASVRDTLHDNFDERLQSLLLAVMGSVEISPSGELVVARPINDARFQQVYSGWYWFIRAGEQRLHSRSAWDLPFDPARTSVSGIPELRTLNDVLGAELRVIEQTVAIEGAREPVTFALAADLSDLNAELADFNRLLVLTCIGLGAGLVLAVVAQVTVGLRPLQRVTQDVERVRSGAKTQLDTVGLREIDGLVDQVNTLIEQDRKQVERARANASDLAHGLKTPLAILRSSLDAVTESERLEQVAQIERTLERQLARAAMVGPREGARTDVTSVAQSLVDGMRKIHAARALTIECTAASPAFFMGDQEDIEEMLGNLIDNACKWARSQVHVSIEQNSEELIIVVEDDGPGMSDSQAQLATERGRRFDTEVSGSGLGLAIVEDIAALYGGTLELTRTATQGMQARLHLPRHPQRADQRSNKRD